MKRWEIRYYLTESAFKSGIPFEIKLPSRAPLSISDLSAEQLEAELQKGVDSVSAGNVHTTDEVDELLRMEFGV